MTQPTDTNVTQAPPREVRALTTVASGDGDRTVQVFSSEAHYAAALRMAKALAASTLVPAEYRGNLPNVLIALELAARTGASVFMVMQNLDIIHGRPSWRSKFLIATVNACGRFTPLRWRWEGKPGGDTWGARVFAKDKTTGEVCEGPLVTLATAKAEGWYSKQGSKWKTLPELMLMYRAAAWWTNTHAPELSLGIQTADEAEDVEFLATPIPEGLAPGSAKELETALAEEAPASAAVDDPYAPREPGEEG